ncbi:MAG: DUF1553 domain-containing protein, partial [Planctomycetes bacterium]|nr:DUF1553 domain-containing protein [Planctomycetota bacterium]
AANAFEYQNVPLKPATDFNRARMIRSSRWGGRIDVEMLNVPAATYQVFLYVWEDNNAERYSILVNDKTVVAEFNSGAAGTWKRLGPWRIAVRDGSLKVSAKGGAANFSGLEVWSGTGTVPDPQVAQFASVPTEEQLQFFESRIRPLLVDHCYECHSQEAVKPGGQLLLDSRAGIIKGGLTAPAIIPGDPDNSLLMKAVGYGDPDLKMPPDEKLSAEQLADLAAWIRMKAPDPRLEDTVAAVKAKSEINWEQARDFWSLRPLSSGAAPEVTNSAWPTNTIDRFVLSRLEKAGLVLADDASQRTLIRRATFDLIGLPPSPAEVAAFLADRSDQAFAKVIDRLLASPQYGERWGRHWLDVVRYSDTAGDNSDFPIPQAYLYRNWVIEAFNRDLPYDEFVREQLAGDLLEGGSPEQRRSRIIATGYIANSRRFGSRVDDYPQHLTIEDTIDNLGRTFLATTVNCARCHNHKFDPVTVEDYYALYGIFHSTRYPWPGIELEQRQRDFVALAPPQEVARIQQERNARQKELDAQVQRLKKERDAANGDARQALEKQLKAAEDAARTFTSQPLPYETIYAVADTSAIGDVPVQLKGDPTKPGEVVPRRFLKVLRGARLPDDDLTSGRLQLANWIVDRSNPLTARVMANRIWQHHFGKPLVATANDFGRHGQAPSHPELLDWLARHFMDGGWSIKSMHRTIMLSHTYRLSSQPSTAAVEKDPTNQLLSAYPRHRLEAEAIRDTLLLLGGNLDPTPGGAHPFPPPGEWKFTQHNPFKAIYESNRRSVYLMTQRIQRHPYLAIFDGADPATSTPVRLTSTTPLQALYLLNDKFVHEQARGMTTRLLAENGDDAQRIEQAWLWLFSRPPDSNEVSAATSFLGAVKRELQTTGTSPNDLDQHCWQALVRSLLRLNEFVYVD